MSGFSCGRGSAPFSVMLPAISYSEALAFIERRRDKTSDWRRLPGGATRLVRTTAQLGDEELPCIAVQYHSTRVVRYFEDGRVLLSCGGWRTITTRYKIETYCPQVWVYTETMRVVRRERYLDPLVEEAVRAVEDRGAPVHVDGRQPSLNLTDSDIVLWPDGLLATDEETREQALQRIAAWRDQPPAPVRVPRFTARRPNPNQLRLPIAA